MIEPVDTDALLEEWHETSVRVRYAETDQMGVVYHANYLVWFEIGRTEFCRARGFAYRDMEENDRAYLVVAESVIIAEGETGHVVTDPTGRVISLPDTYRAALSAPPLANAHGERVPED